MATKKTTKKAEKPAEKKAESKTQDETGVLTYDNRQKYGVMQAATTSERPALRATERRGNARAARAMKRR